MEEIKDTKFYFKRFANFSQFDINSKLQTGLTLHLNFK
jgi:hypothetical protein